MKKIVIFVLVILTLVLHLTFVSCQKPKSIGELIAEGNYQEAYLSAAEEGNRALQEELLWKSAVDNAIDGYLNYAKMCFTPLNVENAYYHLYKDAQEIVHCDVLLEIIGRSKDDEIKSYYYLYKDYRIATIGNTTVISGVSINFSTIRSVGGSSSLEFALGDFSLTIDADYVIEKGVKLSTEQLNEVQALNITSRVNLQSVDASWITKSAQIAERSIEDALQGAWDCEDGIHTVIFDEGRYKYAFYGESGNNIWDSIGISVRGTYEITQYGQIILTNDNGIRDATLECKVHKNKLILLEKKDDRWVRWEIKE